MSLIEDARARVKMAKECLDGGDYAGAIREAGACVERSIKALLDSLNIDYTVKIGKKTTYLHDVSDKVPEAFEKLEPCLMNYEVKPAREELARAMVLHKLLISIRNYVEFPVLGLSTGDVFASLFAENLAKVLVDLVETTFYRMSDLVHKSER